MSCLPDSGGCEWKHIKPFISFLNKVENSSYELAECLDKKNRNRPEPEVLCTQSNGGINLVVERKTVVWPIDSIAKHNRDHEIADYLFSELNSLVRDGEYSINLDIGFDGTKKQAKDFAEEIISNVKKDFPRLSRNQEISDIFDGHCWSFREDEIYERDTDINGLAIRWRMSYDSGVYLNPSPDLINEIKRMCDNVILKFKNYLNCRRILLIIPQGQIPLQTKWWKEIFSYKVKVEKEITDIWLTVQEWDETNGYVWLFQKIF